MDTHDESFDRDDKPLPSTNGHQDPASSNGHSNGNSSHDSQEDAGRQYWRTPFSSGFEKSAYMPVPPKELEAAYGVENAPMSKQQRSKMERRKKFKQEEYDPNAYDPLVKPYQPHPGYSWSGWIDPAAIVWMILLVPILTFLSHTSIEATLGILKLPPYEAALAIPWVVSLPIALILVLSIPLLHFENILNEWSAGDRYDPWWPTIELFEILGSMIRWTFTLFWPTLAVAGLAGLLIGIWGWPDAWTQPQIAVGLASTIWIYLTYLPMAISSQAILRSPLSSNPLGVTLALSRIGGPLCYLVLDAVLLVLVFVAGNWMLFLLSLETGNWLSPVIYREMWFWIWFILAGSRMMRLLGRFCYRHSQELGWVRT